MSGGTGQLYRGAEERNANMELERGMLQMKENGRETETVGKCKKRTCAETPESEGRREWNKCIECTERRTNRKRYKEKKMQRDKKRDRRMKGAVSDEKRKRFHAYTYIYRYL